MRLAVVGHVEWVEFARVERVPEAGEIVHAQETWGEAAGGGAVASAQLAKLGGEALFFTALGDDELGHACHREIGEQGVRVEAAFRPRPQRRAFTFVDAQGERTITTLGERFGPAGADPLPWGLLEGADGVYFVSGDAAALQASRRARVLVATARSMPTLREEGVELDALVHSGADPGERYSQGTLDPPPKLVVTTAGKRGGSWVGGEGRTGSWTAAQPPGPISDAYGAGDSFAAGLTFGLAEGRPPEAALELAARCGAAALTGAGAYAGQLRL